MKKIGMLGCGWLGTPLSEALIAKGYSVNGSTTREEKLTELSEKGIHPFLIDLENDQLEALDLFMEGVETLFVTLPPKFQDKNATYVSNLEKLIPYIHKHQVKNVVYTSSVSIYAPNKEVIDETTTLLSNEPTALQIRNAEALFQNDSRFTTCLLRLGGLYGEDRFPVKYICKKETLENPDLPINMIHLADILSFTLALLEENKFQNEIYNFVSPNFKSRKDYYTKQATLYDLALPPSGENHWELEKTISGKKVIDVTGQPYQY